MINPSFWKDKKVFLTGHTGFKGSWLSIWLHDLGVDVLGYALEPNTNPSLYKLANIDSLVQSVIGDIRDFELLKKTMVEFDPDIVIHLAAQPLVRESYENPIDTYTINVMGTVNLLESVRHCKSVKAVLNVTTDKVYENKEWTWGYRENDVLGGFDPYSNSKACSELVTSSYIHSFFNVDRYEEHGVAIATARAGNVIGGGDWAKDRLIPDIIRAIENDKEIVLRNPNAVRPWQHVLEPLAGYMMLVEKLYLDNLNYCGGWNFGPDFESFQTVSWLVKSLVNDCGKHIKIEENLDVLHETQILRLDITKSKSRLNWYPKFSLEETIRLINEWQLAYGKNLDVHSICLNQIRKVSEQNENNRAKE